MLSDSRIEKEGYEEVLDYRMSEKFGLNWKNEDYSRMSSFIEIMTLEGKRKERDNKKQADKNKNKSSYNNFR